MTVVHNHPHPLTMQVVTPSNPSILRLFGRVRVEDWDDRVSGMTVREHASRGTSQEVHVYEDNGGTVPGPDADNQSPVVRCHTLATGEMVLLHADWLPAEAD